MCLLLSNDKNDQVVIISSSQDVEVLLFGCSGGFDAGYSLEQLIRLLIYFNSS